jgi:hypothetical protein
VGADQRTFLDLVVNEVAKGDVLVVLRGGDVLVPVSTLADAGLEAFKGSREAIDGQEFVSLTSLQPAVIFVFNERDLQLVLKVDPALLPSVVREMRSGRPGTSSTAAIHPCS